MGAFISNMNAVKHSIDQAKVNLKNTVSSQMRGVVTLMLRDLAANTPQWSGDLAASWQVVVGGEMAPIGYTGFKQVPYEHPAPHFKGDREAVDYTIQMNAGMLKQIRYNRSISIVNNNPTIAAIEVAGGEAWLRHSPDNFIAGDFMAVKYVAQKYRDKDFSKTRFTYDSPDQWKF